MRVIPVLDVRRGQAVRAVAGDRAHYGPLRSILHVGTDPVELAQAARDTWGLPDLYLADLDAILGQAPPNVLLYQALRNLRLPLWIDAGVREVADVRPLIEAGVERIIVGLETVQGPKALNQIVDEVGPDRIVFSLDLHQGRPIMNEKALWGTEDPDVIAKIVFDTGILRIIHLDLSRVGTGQGIAPLNLPAPSTGRQVEWVVGGGISSVEEIRSLDPTRIHGVLVGSALHQGLIKAGELALFRKP